MRLWLVERSYDTRNTVSLTYASTDGSAVYRRQASLDLLARSPATAAVDRDEADVEPVEDAQRRDRYATEASRMADDHDPDDEI
ncbi:MAG: hypothetical protein ABEH80_10780 [Halobaculum sp.]|jgi:hypothetical protein